MKFQKFHIEPTGRLYAMEIIFRSREIMECNVVVASKKGNHITLVSEYPGISLSDAVGLLKGKRGVVISVTGRGVLLKKISSSVISSAEALRQILPNAQPMDFYVQMLQLYNQPFAGVVRTDWIEPVLQQLLAGNVLFSHLVIGPFSVLILKEQIYTDQLAFAAGGYRFVFSEEKLTEVTLSEKQAQDIIWNETKLPASSVVSFCHLLAYGIGFLKVYGPESELIRDFQMQVTWQKRLRTSLVAGVAACFILLACNLVISRYYSEKYSRLDEQFSENRDKLLMIEKLEQEIKRKKELMGGDFSGGPVLSFLADDLASSVPEGIKLSDLQVFPMTSKPRKDEPLAFDRKKIQVEGVTRQSSDLNTWVKNLKKLNWVKDISIINYLKPQAGSQGEFRLLIEVSV